MRLAVFSDIHGDVKALQDALAQIEKLGCDLTLCLGDLIDDGPDPEATVALLQEASIPTILGNHDRWASASGHDMADRGLSLRTIQFLAGLPQSWRKTIGGRRVVAWHARNRSDMHGIDLNATDHELGDCLDHAAADVLLVGHTHQAFARSVGTRLVCNPGCLLRDPIKPVTPGYVLNTSGKWVEEMPTMGTFGVLTMSASEVHICRLCGHEVIHDHRDTVWRGYTGLGPGTKIDEHETCDVIEKALRTAEARAGFEALLTDLGIASENHQRARDIVRRLLKNKNF